MSGNDRTASLELSRAFCAALLVIVTTTATCIAAPYRLAPGDTVEIAVGSLPEQRYRVQIQIDGTVSLPSAGSVVIAGLTPAEMQSRMEALLPTKIFRQRLPDGREQTVLVKPGDVVTAVVDYRPVYVNGDVLTPGQQAYRGPMSVRQAVSVAGGYSLLRSRGPTYTDPADLTRDYQSLSLDYAKEYFHILRVNAELRGDENFDQNTPNELGLPEAALSPVVKAEAESLKVALADYRQEQAFLQNAATQTDGQIVTLSKQQEAELKGVKDDEDELDRVTKLLATGAGTNIRVSESRRALLLSSTRQLQTTVELIQLRRQRADYGRQLERIESQRTINLLRELKDSSARLADLRARLLALSQKLQPVGGAGPALLMGATNFQPDITIVRKVGQKWEKIPAGEDDEIESGDVIEVSLRPSRAASVSN